MLSVSGPADAKVRKENQCWVQEIKVVQVNENELRKLFVRFRKIVLDLLGRRAADK